MICGSQAGRSGTYDGGTFAGGYPTLRNVGGKAHTLVVCGEAVKIANGKRLLEFAAMAALFAQPRTNSPQGSG